ncbi:hypothetical protein C0995_014718 [Termitomyces sp. Mi166|nr:hypothetical protein C0995_014718 [Termitomyces sp. Mi166\
MALDARPEDGLGTGSSCYIKNQFVLVLCVLSHAMTELNNVLDLFKTAMSMARPAAHLFHSIQRLHKKAHEVLNRSGEGMEGTLSNTELSRWAGKTHLLSEVGPLHSSLESRPSQSVTMHTAVGAKYWSDAQVDSLHPTLVQAMRNFDARSPSFDWFFDFPTTGAPQPQPVLQPPMPEVQMSDPNFYTPDYHGSQPQSHHSPFLQTVSVLDASWQTFAEQLGF